jgi:hypothetical protein
VVLSGVAAGAADERMPGRFSVLVLVLVLLLLLLLLVLLLVPLLVPPPLVLLLLEVSRLSDDLFPFAVNTEIFPSRTVFSARFDTKLDEPDGRER